jgi:hypothetical protein
MEGIKMIKPIIIAGFPGVGKSELFRKYGEEKIADSDSSKFSWLEPGVRNPDFPNNYIEHIKSLIGVKEIICVSTHDVVRKALKDNNIEYILIYPKKECKQTYLENYKNRGNDDNFIKMMNNNWDKFIDGLDSDDGAKHKLTLNDGIYLNFYLINSIKFIEE